MEFFITVGIDSIKDKRVNKICAVVEKKIYSLIADKKYGNGMIDWEHTIFCYSVDFYATKFPNRRYVQNGTKVETYNWIDSSLIKKANEKEVYRLICDSILTSMLFLSDIKEFDYRAFRDDVIALFRREGWIYTSFFMTGETDAIFADKISFGQNSIPEKIKSYISAKDYGPGVNHWGHIVICCNPELYEAGFFKEIKKYTKKDKDVELRLRIDYEAMLKADAKEVNKLICESLLRGVDIVEHELKINDFDFDAFRKDLITLFKKEGWL